VWRLLAAHKTSPLGAQRAGLSCILACISLEESKAVAAAAKLTEAVRCGDAVFARCWRLDVEERRESLGTLCQAAAEVIENPLRRRPQWLVTLAWCHKTLGGVSVNMLEPGTLEYLAWRRSEARAIREQAVASLDFVKARSAGLELAHICVPKAPPQAFVAAELARAAAREAAWAASVAACAGWEAAEAAKRAGHVCRSAGSPPPSNLGAPPASSIEGILALAAALRKPASAPASYLFDRTGIASATDALLRGDSLASLLDAANSSAALRPLPEHAAALLANYEHVARVQRVLQGIEIPMADGFSRVLSRPVSKGYRECVTVINSSLAKAQAAGYVLLFDVRAAPVLQRLGFSDNPLSVVYALGKKPRMIHHCSYGSFRGGYEGSANACTRDEDIELAFGKARTASICDLATVLHRWVLEDPECVPQAALSDVSGAFNRLRFTPWQALALGAAVYDPSAQPGTDAAAFAIFSRGSFGYCGLPTCFYVVAQAARHVLYATHAGHERGLEWFLDGFENFVCPPRAKDVMDYCHFFVDDFIVLDRVNADAKLRSVNFALEALLGPEGSECWTPNAEPAASLRHSELIAADKQVPSSERFTFTGWDCDTRLRVFALGRKGWLSLVDIVFRRLAGATCTGVELESALGSMRHYDRCHPLLRCFTGQWRHLLHRYKRACRAVPLRAAAADLKMWQTVLRTAVQNPASVTFPWRALVEQPQHTAEFATDASSTGGGMLLPFEWAYRWDWTAAELRASKGESPRANCDYFINVLELYAWVAALTTWAPKLKGQVVKCHVDNTSAISWATRWRSRSAPARRLLQWSCLVAFRFNITLDLVYINTLDNTGPDLLSRPRTAEALQAYADFLPFNASPRARNPQELPSHVRLILTGLLLRAPVDLVATLEALYPELR